LRNALLRCIIRLDYAESAEISPAFLIKGEKAYDAFPGVSPQPLCDFFKALVMIGGIDASAQEYGIVSPDDALLPDPVGELQEGVNNFGHGGEVNFDLPSVRIDGE